jgi:hypothetical protein
MGQLQKISRLLNCDIKYLITGEKDEPPLPSENEYDPKILILHRNRMQMTPQQQEKMDKIHEVDELSSEGYL